MSSTNETEHYHFPQWIATDHPSFTSDLNPAFETIDTTLYALSQAVTTAQQAATAAAQAATTAQQAATAAQQAADSAVEILVAMGVSDEAKAVEFRGLVDNAVQKHDILASYFDSES